MKQRKFSLHDFAGGTVLSREEMKNVSGGVAPPGGSGDGSMTCTITNSMGHASTLTFNSTYNCWGTDGFNSAEAVTSSQADSMQLQYGGKTTYTCSGCAGSDPTAN